MEVEIITKDDLQMFRQQLLKDFKQLFDIKDRCPKKWLKNAEVRSLLNVSSSTVQRLRSTGKLKSSKIGGVHYYRLEDLEALLEKGIVS